MTLVDHAVVAERTEDPFPGEPVPVIRRHPKSRARLVTVAIGAVFVAIAMVALSRSGIALSDLKDVPATRTQAAGLHFTIMSALVQLAFGVVSLAVAIHAAAAKSWLAVAGASLLTFGLIVAVRPGPFVHMWGFLRASGAFYAVAGGVALAGSAIAPTLVPSRSMARSAR